MMLDWLSGSVSWLLRNDQVEAYDSSAASLYAAQANLETMRTRDLKSLLLKKLGADADDVKRILDKTELKNLASALISEEITMRGNAVLNERIWKFTLLAIGVSVIFLSRQPVLALVHGFFDYLRTVKYRIHSKSGLIRLALRSRLFLAMAALIAAALLELVSPLMQVSIMASWVLPAHSPFRRFLMPSISIPITAETVMGAVTGKKENARPSQPQVKPQEGSVAAALGNLGSYGLNLGPMLTLMVVAYVRDRLENWAAAHLFPIVEERQRRQESKRQRERDRELARERELRREGGYPGEDLEEEDFNNGFSAPPPLRPDHQGAASKPGSGANTNASTLRGVGFAGPLSMEEILRHGSAEGGVLEETVEGSEERDGGQVWSGGWDELD